jgi:two-component system chemotaxis sensor kinase CheA
MEFKVFDSLLEPVFIIDGEKKILYCNEPAALICDLSVRKLTKGLLFDKVLSFSEDVLFLSCLSNIQDPSPYQELSFESIAGKAGKAQISCQPIANANPAWIIFFRDVTLEETLQKKYRAELEQVQHYSKNLEKMVEDRTAELKKLNSTMSALLDSLHQGFFIFDKEGKCLEVSSKACEATIETNPAGRPIWEVLRLAESQVPGFQKWMLTMFSEMLPFEDLSVLGPQSFPHSTGKKVKLDYYPLRNSESQMEGVVVVASDITSLYEAQREAEIERAHAKMILSLVKNKRQVGGFIRESREIMNALENEIRQGLELDLDETFRHLHTLKGGAASFSIKAMADICHQAESLLASLRPTGVTTLSVHQLKEFCFQIEESFLFFQLDNKEIIGDEVRLQERWVESPISHFVQFRSHHLLPHPAESKAFTESFMMEPIQAFFGYFQEVIKTVAESQGKLIAPLKFEGGDLRILPEPYDNLFSTMIHAFRNAADHGIENPEIRTAKGKSPEGHLTVSFSKSQISGSENLLIKIQDDGGGINPEIIRAKLTERGVDSSAESDDQVIQHIFDSQFSTKEQVSEFSGRGVGMGAILVAAQALNGKVWVESTLGQGTVLFVEVTFITEFPVSLKTQKAA